MIFRCLKVTSGWDIWQPSEIDNSEVLEASFCSSSFGYESKILQGHFHGPCCLCMRELVSLTQLFLVMHFFDKTLHFGHLDLKGFDCKAPRMSYLTTFGVKTTQPIYTHARLFKYFDIYNTFWEWTLIKPIFIRKVFSVSPCRTLMVASGHIYWGYICQISILDDVLG